jgi:uncharacterized coiled-coil protein SlyX
METFKWTVTGITETTVKDESGAIVYDGSDYELTHEEAKKRAKLIADAPKLLAALQEIVREDYDYWMLRKQLCAVIHRLQGIASKAINRKEEIKTPPHRYGTQ